MGLCWPTPLIALSLDCRVASNQWLDNLWRQSQHRPVDRLMNLWMHHLCTDWQQMSVTHMRPDWLSQGLGGAGGLCLTCGRSAARGRSGWPAPSQPGRTWTCPPAGGPQTYWAESAGHHPHSSPSPSTSKGGEKGRVRVKYVHVQPKKVICAWNLKPLKEIEKYKRE